MTQKTDLALQGFVSETAERLSQAMDEPDWAQERRLEALRVYNDTPLPARTDEGWRRTDFSPLQLDTLHPSWGSDALETPEEGKPWLEAIPTLGALAVQRNAQAEVLECSDELGKGVLVTTLGQALREHGELVKPYLGLKGTLPTYHKFAALNSAFWSGGLFIYVPANVNVAAPIVNLRWLDEQGAMLPRTLVVLERGASLTFMEGGLSTERQEQCLNCSVTDFFVQDGAQLNYLGLQQWSSNVWDISTTRTSLGRDSRLNAFSASFGGAVTRAHFDALLEGTGSEADMQGFYIGTARQHFDFRTLQDHTGQHSRSNLLYKGALRDRSGAAYEGTVRVRRGATSANANQQNHNLILSKGARADSVPVLEIEASDVDKCSHGATAGQVDDAQLFYLMSRGLSHDEAHQLIVAAFFEPLLRKLPIPAVREHLTSLVVQKLALLDIELDEATP